MNKEYGILSLPSSKNNESSSFEMGWKFTVGAENIQVMGLRVYLPVAQTVTAKLWGDSTTPIASVTISASANQWTEGAFDSIITLTAGNTYTISCYNNNRRYYATASQATFNPKITFNGGVFNSTSGTKPTNVESNYLYPFIDIIIPPPSYKTSGNVVFTLNNYAVGGDDALHWTGDTPTGTSLKLYTKVDNGNYTEIATSGGRIQGLPSSGTCTLHIKAELATTDVYSTPKLSSITIKANADKKVLTLSFANPNLSPAIGPVSVAYDGLGGLQGLGGPSEAFDGDFTTGLTWKGNQNDEEHIAFSMDATAVLTQITYSDTMEKEHIEMTLSAVATLTDIHDL